ncbi:hypothetical protein PLICRDRAFT_526648 [Plicaturopsis crispa FD-325 SS-3]|nr:hypothetical protein PLICRDRAFT_526648 [Plicaturopsis crispa FD-325 SS-3]
MKSTSASSSSKHNLAFDESELAEARSGKPPAKRTRQSQSTDDRRSISSVVWVAEECVLVDVAGLLCKQYKTLLQTHSKCFERVFRGEKDRNVVDTEMKAQGLKVYGVSGVSASDFEKLMLVLGVGAL